MQTELHLAHVGRGENLADILRISDIGIWIREVHVVQIVEVLPLEFQRLAFRNPEHFSEREVHLVETRATQRVVVHVSISPYALRNDEGRGIGDTFMNIDPEPGIGLSWLLGFFVFAKVWTERAGLVKKKRYKTKQFGMI